MRVVRKLHSDKLEKKQERMQRKVEEHKKKMGDKEEVLELKRKKRRKDVYRRLGKKEAKAQKSRE